MDFEIPKTYRAAVYDKPGSISTRIDELQVPEPGAGEVLVRLTHSGVCGSDLSIMLNGWKSLPFPTAVGQIGGHEGVGVVHKLGAGIEGGSIKVGDRVGIKWAAAACGTCPNCRNGFDGHCNLHKISGYYTPGTFAEYVLGPANYVTPIPENLSSVDAAPMLCAGLTTYSALRKCGAASGQFVVVSGAGGGLGHIAVQIASRGMAYRVIGIDHPSKEAIVMESGAEAFIDMTKFDDESIAAEVVRLTEGLGAASVIVCAGSNRAYNQAMPMLCFGGSLVCVGLPEGDPVAISSATPMAMTTGQKRIVGSTVGSQREAMEVLAMAARGVIKTHVRVEKLDKLDEVFQSMHERTLEGRVVLDLQ